MTVFVSVRSLPDLAEHVAAHGSQTHVAREAGVGAVRLNQLLRGSRTTVSLDFAARLEDALDVPRGSLFGFPDPSKAAPYATAGIGAA